MDRERETATDLSHRLRTPLTALKLDIEALGQTADVTRLQRDVDGLERVVSHVISEARRSVRDGAGTVADLAAVVESRAAYWGSLAEDQGRKWSSEVQPAATRWPAMGRTWRRCWTPFSACLRPHAGRHWISDRTERSVRGYRRTRRH